MSDVVLDELLACGIEATQAAGRHAKDNWGRRHEVAQSFDHDVKLKLDIESQVIAETVIRSHFPNHLILGEEDVGTTRPDGANDDELEWIIDPIDGTVNFSHGLPMWCCSIAVRSPRDILAGVVYGPALDQLFTATRGGPATLNGAELHVSPVDSLTKSMVFTGLDRTVPDIPPLTLFERIALNTQKARVLGSAALDISRVAQGHGEGYFESGIYIWDVAAAGLIVEQAGGRIETLAQYPDGRLQFVATNGLIHEDLRKLLVAR